jgi:hypothetical protein
MAQARIPSYAAPLKAAQQASSSFSTKVRDHAAIRADPLLKSQAEWISSLLRDFAVAVEGRAKPGRSNG